MSSSAEGQKRKFKRKLTPFLCQEMLYDYAIDRLDSERKAAVEEFLKTDKECQSILESIRQSLAYTERLKRTRLKSSVATHLRESENAISLGRKYSSWGAWPDVLRWSITAILLSITVAGIVAVIPWAKIPSFRSKKSDVIEIAQLTRPIEKQHEEANENIEGDNNADEGSGDEEIEPPESAAPVVAKAGKKPTPPPAGDNRSSGDEGEEGDESDTPTSNAVAGGQQTEGTGASGENAQSQIPKEAKAKGFVFRAFMTLTNLEDVGPKITDSITELGGEKAGEVELGWKRGAGRYYHFAMPEENEEKLLEKLRAYGPVRISKDPHPRVMPRGQIRFILWVESAK